MYTMLELPFIPIVKRETRVDGDHRWLLRMVNDRHGAGGKLFQCIRSCPGFVYILVLELLSEFLHKHVPAPHFERSATFHYNVPVNHLR